MARDCTSGFFADVEVLIALILPVSHMQNTNCKPNDDVIWFFFQPIFVQSSHSIPRFHIGIFAVATPL